MATPAQIADAVTAELNATSFALPFEAVRAYKPVFKLEQMDTLRVTVIAATIARTQISRGHKSQVVRIDVAVQKRPKELTNDDLDQLATLCEEIAEHFPSNPSLPAPASARWITSETDPIYDPDHLERLNQFTSVVRLTFQKIGA